MAEYEKKRKSIALGPYVDNVSFDHPYIKGFCTGFAKMGEAEFSKEKKNVMDVFSRGNDFGYDFFKENLEGTKEGLYARIIYLAEAYAGIMPELGPLSKEQEAFEASKDAPGGTYEEEKGTHETLFDSEEEEELVDTFDTAVKKKKKKRFIPDRLKRKLLTQCMIFA